MADIDYDQQNRIRVALGLKALPSASGHDAASPSSLGPQSRKSAHATRAPSRGSISTSDTDSDSDVGSEDEPASTLETREAAGYGNWKRLQDEAEAKRERAAKAAEIKKARNAAQKHLKLEGKGLGDAVLGGGGDDGGADQDTRSWLLGAKKRQKTLERERVRAKKLEEELAERERLAGFEYGARDLAGVKVGHDVEDFDETQGEQVLVLKDTTIDENEEEGDELENLEMREKDKLKERLELKKKKPVYDPHAADAEADGQKKILMQYDEEIDGKKRKHFVFDGQGTTAEEREAKRREVGTKMMTQSISLDFFKDEAKSDYMELSEVKMKKPKKSKKKTTRQRLVEEDADMYPQQVNGGSAANDPTAMDIDQVMAAQKPKAKEMDKEIADDEDLQASLAVQRRAAFKKRKKQRPEDIAREIQDEASAVPTEMDVDAADGEPGLVIDETSEFVANLQRPSEADEKQAPKARSSMKDRPEVESEDDSDVDMKEVHKGEEDEAALAAHLQQDKSLAQTHLTTTGLDEEETLDSGLGGAFNLLKQRGLVKTADTGDLNALHSKRQMFLADKQKREADAEQRARAQRERDRASGKLERMSAREREEYARWENKQRDHIESRQMADIFNRDYKPNVQLKYVDEHGRSMGKKEAFKHLSHQFHGKGSGHQKTEKHLKKIGDEKKREAMSALDASQATGMNNAMGTAAKRNKQAGVRLG